MSYDLMVFNPKAAPRTESEFNTWCEQQTEWSEDHNYDDPKVSSPELQAWFMEMTTIFPAMNGPCAPDDIEERMDEEDLKLTDHCVGHDVIYSAFSWSVADEAFSTTVRLAAKHRVGFLNASNDGSIWFPTEDGDLECINPKPRKPWWKFW